MANVKRNKRSRLRRSKSAGHGAKKKWRGSGTRGGVGMAGTGKKAGQKLTLLKFFPNYLGKKGFKRHVPGIKNFKVINLEEISLKLNKLETKKTTAGVELNLKGYKVLGKGEISEKLIVNAESFSATAKKKIEAKGGKAQVLTLKK